MVIDTLSLLSSCALLNCSNVHCVNENNWGKGWMLWYTVCTWNAEITSLQSFLQRSFHPFNLSNSHFHLTLTSSSLISNQRILIHCSLLRIFSLLYTERGWDHHMLNITYKEQWTHMNAQCVHSELRWNSKMIFGNCFQSNALNSAQWEKGRGERMKY